MSNHYCAWNRVEWDEAGLKDFCDFSDCIEYKNQSEYGDGQLEGHWFYDDAEKLTLYWGSFGNYSSPGASSNTHAIIYDNEKEFKEAVAHWESLEEYLESDEDDVDTDVTEPEEDDYTSEDHCKWYQYGKLVLDLKPEDDHVTALRAHMDAAKFWPNCFVISDHGNVCQIDMSENPIPPQPE